MSLRNQNREAKDSNNRDEVSQSETIDSGCVSDSSDSSLDIVNQLVNKESYDDENEEENLNLDRKFPAKVMSDSGFFSDGPSKEIELSGEQSKRAEGKYLYHLNDSVLKATLNEESSTSWSEIYQQNDDGNTKLHLACLSVDINTIKTLLFIAPHPCLYDTLNYDCRTPLHLATLAQRPKILRALLLAGASPAICDRQGNTALHLACRSGVEESVLAIIAPFSEDEVAEFSRAHVRHNVSTCISKVLEMRNYNGEGCVHLTAKLGFVNILRLLTSHGADINSREYKSGRTPLHIAIESGNELLANFLLDECEKIDLEITTFSGLTPYQLSSQFSRTVLQNKLVTLGAAALSASESEDDSSETDSDSDSDSETDDSKDNVSESSGFPIFTNGRIEMADVKERRSSLLAIWSTFPGNKTFTVSSATITLNVAEYVKNASSHELKYENEYETLGATITLQRPQTLI
uniref:Uncharacterized protein n=1 Tax=Glossina pallidipes TaxID=7398 RepID=A0A1A9Z1N5_GLOPL